MIEFFLRAFPTYKKNVVTKKVIMTPKIEERFRFYPNPDKPLSFTEGTVDEDIKKQNKEDYEAFCALINEQQDALYAECFKNMGVEVKPEAKKKEKVAPVFEAPIELTEDMVVEEDDLA